MSKKHKLSFFHITHKKKLSKKKYPNYKQSFSIKYFKQHTKKNFKNNTKL